MTQHYDLTSGSILKKLILFFLPIAAGALFQQLYNTVDAVIVGKFVGTTALAAVGGSAAMIIALFIGFFVALTGGSSAVIAQLAGAKQEDSVSKAVHSAFAFSICAGVLLSCIGIPLTPRILELMKTPADTMAESTSYLRIYLSGAVFMLIFNMGSSILQALGDSRRPLLFLMISCICNIFLDLYFVLILHLGTSGVAYATVLSQLISSLLILHRFSKMAGAHQLVISKVRIHPDLMKRMLQIGIPAGLQSTMYSVSNMIIQIGINSLMTAVVAAWSVSSKVDGIYSCICNALGIAVMGFVGQNFGAQLHDRVHKALVTSLKFFIPVTIVLGTIVLLFSKYCLNIFIDDPIVIQYTQKIMWSFVPFYIIWTFIEIMSATLKGMGDALIPLIIIGIGVCGIRIIWVEFIFPFFHTASGLTMCYPVSWFITATALGIYYLCKIRKKSTM